MFCSWIGDEMSGSLTKENGVDEKRPDKLPGLCISTYRTIYRTRSLSTTRLFVTLKTPETPFARTFIVL